MLHLVADHPVALDSGGFVASLLYRGSPFTVAQFMDLQGHRVEHYLRCIDKMPDLTRFPLIGIGSMCRRHVEDDEIGILRIVEEPDRAFRSTRWQFHCFGLKTSGMRELRQHPRVQSVDSQAWGLEARIDARNAGISKSDAYPAKVMERCYRDQLGHLHRPDYAFRGPVSPIRFRQAVTSTSPFEARIEEAAGEMRALFEAGEIEWSDMAPERVLEWAMQTDDD